MNDFDSDSETDRMKLPEWKRKSYEVGEIFFIKRGKWKNAGGFSNNVKRAGHPGLLTIPSGKGSRILWLVPGTSTEPKGHKMFFRPRKDILYTKKGFKQKKSCYVLDYWRSVSRKGPFTIGSLDPSDCELLQSKMIEVHRYDYIKEAFGDK